MHKTPLLIYIVLSCFFVAAQAPEIEWQKIYGGTDDDDAYCGRHTTDGGFIFCGSRLISLICLQEFIVVNS